MKAETERPTGPQPLYDKPLCDRLGREQVERVVHAFYEKVRHHPRLQARFARISDFPAHEAQIIEFWWIAMGGRSRGPRVHEMVARHRTLGLTEEDFACWLAVFDKTLQEILPADLAGEWKQMAEGIADRLKAKLL